MIHPSKKGAVYTFYSTPRPKAEYPQHNGFSTFVKMLRCETTDLDITINIKNPFNLRILNFNLRYPEKTAANFLKLKKIVSCG